MALTIRFSTNQNGTAWEKNFFGSFSSFLLLFFLPSSFLLLFSSFLFFWLLPFILSPQAMEDLNDVKIQETLTKGRGVFIPKAVSKGTRLLFPDDAILKVDLEISLFNDFPESFPAFTRKDLEFLYREVYNPNNETNQMMFDLLLLLAWKDNLRNIRNEIFNLSASPVVPSTFHQSRFQYLNALAKKSGIEGFDLQKLDAVILQNQRHEKKTGRDNLATFYVWKTFSYLNHACSPNLELVSIVKDRALFIAVEDIPVDAELTIQYKKKVCDLDFRPCRCESCESSGSK